MTTLSRGLVVNENDKKKKKLLQNHADSHF